MAQAPSILPLWTATVCLSTLLFLSLNLSRVLLRPLLSPFALFCNCVCCDDSVFRLGVSRLGNNWVVGRRIVSNFPVSSFSFPRHAPN